MKNKNGKPIVDNADKSTSESEGKSAEHIMPFTRSKRWMTKMKSSGKTYHRKKGKYVEIEVWSK